MPDLPLNQGQKARLTAEQRERIAVEVWSGISLWFIASTWNITEQEALKIAGVNDEEAVALAEWRKREAHSRQVRADTRREWAESDYEASY